MVAKLAKRFLSLWGASADLEPTYVPTSGLRSLAEAIPSRRLIRYDPTLEAHPQLLIEVMCHELAHVVAHEIYGPDVEPHGPEWASLVRAAGYEPTTHFRVPGQPLRPLDRKKQRVRYVHRCPVCHSTRSAAAPQTRWRCGPCQAAGLAGNLEIESVPIGTRTR
jgi:SprT protein